MKVDNLCSRFKAEYKYNEKQLRYKYFVKNPTKVLKYLTFLINCSKLIPSSLTHYERGLRDMNLICRYTHSYQTPGITCVKSNVCKTARSNTQ